MSNIEKYAHLHKYATRLAEDDLTSEVGPEGTVAFAVGRAISSIGNAIEETAQRLHRSDNPEAVENFIDDLGGIASVAAGLARNVNHSCQPFLNVKDDIGDTPLKKAAFVSEGSEDNPLTTVLAEAAHYFIDRKEAAK